MLLFLLRLYLSIFFSVSRNTAFVKIFCSTRKAIMKLIYCISSMHYISLWSDFQVKLWLLSGNPEMKISVSSRFNNVVSGLKETISLSIWVQAGGTQILKTIALPFIPLPLTPNLTVFIMLSSWLGVSFEGGYDVLTVTIFMVWRFNMCILLSNG